MDERVLAELHTTERRLCADQARHALRRVLESEGLTALHFTCRAGTWELISIDDALRRRCTPGEDLLVRGHISGVTRTGNHLWPYYRTHLPVLARQAALTTVDLHVTRDDLMPVMPSTRAIAHVRQQICGWQCRAVLAAHPALQSFEVHVHRRYSSAAAGWATDALIDLVAVNDTDPASHPLGMIVEAQINGLCVAGFTDGGSFIGLRPTADGMTVLGAGRL